MIRTAAAASSWRSIRIVRGERATHSDPARATAARSPPGTTSPAQVGRGDARRRRQRGRRGLRDGLRAAGARAAHERAGRRGADPGPRRARGALVRDLGPGRRARRRHRARFAELGLDLIPGDGLLAATVPAALDAWCTPARALRHAQPRGRARAGARARQRAAIPCTRSCAPCSAFSRRASATSGRTSAALYLPLRRVGEPQTNPALAARSWASSSTPSARRRARARRDPRRARLLLPRPRRREEIEQFLAAPVRDASGPRARGLLRAADLARATRARSRIRVSARYRDSQVSKCGPWSQGPVFLQQLPAARGLRARATRARTPPTRCTG